jgi:hypothetical protein
MASENAHSKRRAHRCPQVIFCIPSLPCRCGSCLSLGCPVKRILIVSIGLLLLGCGPKPGSGGTVSGTIRYNGKPVNGAMLHLHPDSESSDEVSIPVTQEGTFRASNVPPGEYKIVVEGRQGGGMSQMPTKGMDPAKAAEMKEKLQGVGGQEAPTISYPAKYKKIATTDLKCTIKDGDQKLPLELKD